MPDEQQTLFGRIATRQGLLTEEQLEECLAQQRSWSQPGPVPRIGELMASKGLLTQEQVKSLLLTQQRERAEIELPGYTILGMIGRGGMGTVYKARQLSMDKLVAIKVLSPELARDRQYIARFVREARSAGKLNHPNIVQGFDVGDISGRYYFVMEFVSGVSVREMLRKDGKIPEKQALQIGIQIARALDHACAHNIIHRDVKPDNILITSEGAAKLADLGLAKTLTEDSHVTIDGRSLGTPYYASPEQAQASLLVDTRSDIYSLGATLYHMISGRVPFEGPSPAAVMAKHLTQPLPSIEQMAPDFSPATAAIVHKMMEKSPKKRYQTPAELIRDLALAIEGKPPALATQAPTQAAKEVEAKPPRPEHRAKPSAKPRRGKSAAIIALIAALALGAGALYHFTQRPSNGNGGPANHTTSPAEMNKQANALLAAARQVEMDRPPVNPANIEAALAAYQKILTEARFATLPAAQQAQQRIDKLRKTLGTLHADSIKDLTALNRDTETLTKQSRYGEAIALLERFAEERPGTQAAPLARKQIEAISQQAASDFAELSKQAEHFVEKKEFDQARRLYDVVQNSYGLPDLARQAREHIERINAQHQAYLAERAAQRQEEAQRIGEFNGLIEKARAALDAPDCEAAANHLDEAANLARLDTERQQIALLRSDLFDKLIGAVDAALASFGYEAAGKLLDQAEKQAGLPDQVEAVATRRNDLALLQTLQNNAVHQLKQSPLFASLAREGEPLISGTVTDATSVESVTLRTESGAQTQFKWSDLPFERARSLLRRSLRQDLEPSQRAEVYKQFALLELYHGEPDRAQKSLADAVRYDKALPGKEELEERINGALALAHQSAAKTLHEAAKAEQDPIKALELYAQLMKEHGQTPYVTDRQAEINMEIAARENDVFDRLFPQASEAFRQGNEREAEEKLGAIERAIGNDLTDTMKTQIAGLREKMSAREPGFSPMQKAFFYMFAGNDAEAVRQFQAVIARGGPDAREATRFVDAMKQQDKLLGSKLSEHPRESLRLDDVYLRVAALRLMNRDRPDVTNAMYFTTKYAAHELRRNLQNPQADQWADAIIEGGVRAEQSSPYGARLLVRLAESYLDRDDVSGAEGTFQRVLKDYPDALDVRAEAAVGIAMCELASNKPRDALKRLESVVTGMKDQANAVALAWLILGEAYEAHRDYQKAADAYRQSYRVPADSERPSRLRDALHNGARVYGKYLKKPEEAAELVDRLRHEFAGYYKANQNELDGYTRP